MAVIIPGKGYVSTEALQILAEDDISVVMLDKRGKFFDYFNQVRGSDPPLIRQKQYKIILAMKRHWSLIISSFRIQPLSYKKI